MCSGLKPLFMGFWMSIQVLFILGHSMGCIHVMDVSRKVSNYAEVLVGGSMFYDLMVRT